MSNKANVEDPLAPPRPTWFFPGQSRIVVPVLLGASVLILFPASTIDCVADTMPKGVPPWFKKLDTDKDGQVSISEWRKGGKALDDFRKHDLNGDGFITPDEMLRTMKKPNLLELKNDRADYKGTIEASVDERYQGKKSFKVFTIRLERGKTYQIEYMSRMFFAYLYLEDPAGRIIAQQGAGGWGLTSRIIHRATRAGIHRIIATSLDGIRAGACTLSVRLLSGVKGLPAWFTALDTNKDGQVSLTEWRKGGRKRADFRKHDLNGDGFITPDELLRTIKKPNLLELINGKAEYKGTIDESIDEKYQGKKFFKAFTIKLEKGKTYQIEMVSQVFFPFLYLEGPGGDLLGQHNGGWTRNSRLIYRATKTGTYRIIAASQTGQNTITCTLTVRLISAMKDLPAWFKALDTNKDGQVSLTEWRKGGRKRADFRKHDLNGDGFITIDEVLRTVAKPNHLELINGKAEYKGTIEEEIEARYQGRKSFKIFTIRWNKGRPIRSRW